MGSNESVEAEMYSRIRSWQQSGLSQKAWCEQHQIKYHVFHYWYKRYRQQPSPAIQNPFIPLQLSSCPTTNTACLELILVDGRRLLFHQPVNPDYLKAIMS
jgi:hypothetical protein